MITNATVESEKKTSPRYRNSLNNDEVSQSEAQHDRKF